MCYKMRHTSCKDLASCIIIDDLSNSIIIKIINDISLECTIYNKI